MFFPGETITHTFYIPFSSAELQEIVISYKQNEAIILEKIVTESEDESAHLSKIEIQLTQSESLLFQDNCSFSIQLNIYAIDGCRYTSHEMKSNNGIQYLREITPLGGGQ